MAKPLKRHPALIPLSQDHHFGLLLSWKIRQGIKFGIEHDRIRDYLNYFMLEHLEVHFHTEEEALFTYLAKNDLLRKEAEGQHEALRSLFLKISKDQQVLEEDLKQFAEDLDRHIRFEERKLFPYIQIELPEKDLAEFQQKLEDTHEKVQEIWQDEFWVKK